MICFAKNLISIKIIKKKLFDVGRQQEDEADGWLLHYLGLFTKKNKHEEEKVWWCLKTLLIPP